MVYPSGRWLELARDNEGRITSVSTRKTAADPVEVVINGTMAWRPMSQLPATLTFANDLALTNTWTNDYLHKRILLDYSGGGTWIDRDITFDAQNQADVKTITDAVTPDETINFTYTLTGRLITASNQGGDQDESFGYDGTGNRVERVDYSGATAVTDTYNYVPGTNRIDTITQGATTIRTFGYDGAGHIISDNRAGTNYAYAYNAPGQLANVTVGGVQSGAYTYNGLSQLSERTVTSGGSSTTTHLIQDIFGNIIAEADDTGQTLREYLYIPSVGHAGVSLPIAVVDDVDTATPVVYFVHTDHLSRPVMMTDASRTVVWEAVFTPWGAVKSVSGSLTHDARFPGQWFQLESGLHYNWHRHYDPTLGRFTSPDPLGFVDGPAIYAYAGNEPVSYVDEDGLVRGRRGGPSLNPYYNRLGRARLAPNQSAANRSTRPPQQCSLIDPAGRGGVYVLYNPITGRFEYVGRTNDLMRRKREWGRNPETEHLEFQPLARTDSYSQQRALEHKYYQRLQPSRNRNKPVSPRNQNRGRYLQSLKGIAY